MTAVGSEDLPTSDACTFGSPRFLRAAARIVGARASRVLGLWRAVSDSRGQSLIEFALVAPLVLMFLWIIVDFGIALDRRIVLQHAVREGAREAAVKVDPTLAKDMVVAQSQGLVQTGQVDVCFVDLNGDGIANALEPIKVSTSYTYKFSMPFGKLATAWGASWSDIILDPNATAALENDPIGPVFTECPP